MFSALWVCCETLELCAVERGRTAAASPCDASPPRIAEAKVVHCGFDSRPVDAVFGIMVVFEIPQDFLGFLLTKAGIGGADVLGRPDDRDLFRHGVSSS